MKHRRKAAASIAAVSAAAMLLASCSSGGGGTSSAGDGKGDVTVWAHQGKDSEVAALQDAVSNFNSSQSDVTVKLTLVPEADYTTTIQSTAAKDLPDVLELDGPTLSSFVYDAKVSPIKDYVSKATVDNATGGSVQEGTVDGKLYALAQFNSGLGLCANGAMLDAAGVKYPTSIDTAWTADEFLAALKKLAAANPSGYALDIKENYGLGGEWGTYAFSPLLQSAGGNLIDKNKASGVLDGAASVSAMKAFQSWMPYVDPDEDDSALGQQASGHQLVRTLVVPRLRRCSRQGPRHPAVAEHGQWLPRPAQVRGRGEWVRPLRRVPQQASSSTTCSMTRTWRR